MRWDVYVHSGQVAANVQLDFSAPMHVGGSHVPTVAPGHDLAIEFPNGGRVPGSVVEQRGPDLVVEVGNERWLLRPVTPQDSVIPRSNPLPTTRWIAVQKVAGP